jgi:hypothetical protein
MQVAILERVFSTNQALPPGDPGLRETQETLRCGGHYRGEWTITPGDHRGRPGVRRVGA